MPPVISRLILIVLVARAIAAPVALRPRLADQAGHGGFGLRFLAAEPDSPEPGSVRPQVTQGTPDGGLVFRVCFWPAPRPRSTTPDRLRRSVKLRATAWCSLLFHRLDHARSPVSSPGVAPKLSTDRYLRHALGQQRC